MSLKYYYISALSCASFTTFYKYLNPPLTTKFIPNFKNLSCPKQVEWGSRTNSSLHAILVSFLCLYCLIYENEISQDPIWGESDLVRTTCAIVVGYMCSDVIILLVHYSKIGELFILFHHAASIYAFCFAMTYGALLWFANIKLIAEFSTPFVNKRWFLEVLCYKKYSLPVMLNGMSMTIIFFFVRVTSIPFYWLKVYSIYGSEKCDTLGKIWYVLISSCLILDVINLFWFFKITQGMVRLLKTNSNVSTDSFASSSHIQRSLARHQDFHFNRPVFNNLRQRPLPFYRDVDMQITTSQAFNRYCD